MKVVFLVSNFTVRGTEVAIYDYAFYNQKILNNTSIIATTKNHTQPVNQEVLTKFISVFGNILLVSELTELDMFCYEHKVDAVYTIKYGNNDGYISKCVPTLIHCVYFMKEKHGFVYAGISESVTNTALSGEKYSYVPHIVTIAPSDGQYYRQILNISPEAIVFGRHGGSDTFDIPFVKDVILKIVNLRPDVYFIFAVEPSMFTRINHPQIKFIEEFVNPQIKRRFIDTCDAMIHASSLGESFGLSVLEFSACNKPVITWSGGKWHTQHLKNLGEKAVIYHDEKELLKLLINFKKEDYQGKDWNVSHNFTPEKVMTQFKKVFLDPIPQK